MVHVCFAINDKNGNYVKYLATAICSLLENTNSKVSIHIMHDESLNKKTQEKLMTFVENYSQSICFYYIDQEELKKYEDMCSNFTLASLYRLRIVDELPNNISKVIYLDADVIVDLDIRQLWQYNIGDKLVAARLDVPHNSLPIKEKLLPQNEYFNSGVLIFNLDRIRGNINIYNECKKYFDKYPSSNFPDQDALNVVFKNEVFYLPYKYNNFTTECRKERKEEIGSIFHFAGDGVRLDRMDYFDAVFMFYMARTPWGKEQFTSLETRTKLVWGWRSLYGYRNIIKRSKNKEIKIIIWTPNSILLKKITDIVPINGAVDYGVDSNWEFWGHTINGIRVISPEEIKKEDKGSYVVIILSNRFYDEIKNILLSWGQIECVDFIDGRNLITEKCYF